MDLLASCQISLQRKVNPFTDSCTTLLDLFPHRHTTIAFSLFLFTYCRKSAENHTKKYSNLPFFNYY